MLNYQNKYYLFYQIANMIFLHPELETEPVLTAKWRLLEQVKTEISQKLTKSLQKIPREQRDAEMVLVITEQFLGASHGPTKTALDRCVSLVNAMGKKVLLINTAELFTEVGKMPILFYYKGNYNKILSEQEFQSWKGVEIPYFQCDCTLPEVQIYEVLLQMVEQIKQLLGFINYFVEHCDCHVVVIGEEKYLDDKTQHDLLEFKEKTEIVV